MQAVSPPGWARHFPDVRARRALAGSAHRQGWPGAIRDWRLWHTDWPGTLRWTYSPINGAPGTPCRGAIRPPDNTRARGSRVAAAPISAAPPCHRAFETPAPGEEFRAAP